LRKNYADNLKLFKDKCSEGKKEHELSRKTILEGGLVGRKSLNNEDTLNIIGTKLDRVIYDIFIKKPYATENDNKKLTVNDIKSVLVVNQEGEIDFNFNHLNFNSKLNKDDPRFETVKTRANYTLSNATGSGVNAKDDLHYENAKQILRILKDNEKGTSYSYKKLFDNKESTNIEKIIKLYEEAIRRYEMFKNSPEGLRYVLYGENIDVEDLTIKESSSVKIIKENGLAGMNAKYAVNLIKNTNPNNPTLSKYDAKFIKKALDEIEKNGEWKKRIEKFGIITFKDSNKLAEKIYRNREMMISLYEQKAITIEYLKEILENRIGFLRQVTNVKDVEPFIKNINDTNYIKVINVVSELAIKAIKPYSSNDKIKGKSDFYKIEGVTSSIEAAQAASGKTIADIVASFTAGVNIKILVNQNFTPERIFEIIKKLCSMDEESRKSIILSIDELDLLRVKFGHIEHYVDDKPVKLMDLLINAAKGTVDLAEDDDFTEKTIKKAPVKIEYISATVTIRDTINAIREFCEKYGGVNFAIDSSSLLLKYLNSEETDANKRFSSVFEEESKQIDNIIAGLKKEPSNEDEESSKNKKAENIKKVEMLNKMIESLKVVLDRAYEEHKVVNNLKEETKKIGREFKGIKN